MWPITLSGRLPIVGLVGRYPANCLMGREATFYRITPLTPLPCGTVVLCGISVPFGTLSPCRRQVPHALLTRPPLELQSFLPKLSISQSSFDLHVLSTPPAFVLSQDQTLVFNPADFFPLNPSGPFGPSGVSDSFELTVVLHPDSSGCLILYRFQDPRALRMPRRGLRLSA